MPRNTIEGAKILARQARKSPSVAESIVWKMLRARREEFKFRREHPIGNYRIDFYCSEAKFAVELDGEQHDPKNDEIRDSYLLDQGIFTYRIPNREFFHLDSNPVTDHINEVIKLCKERTSNR